MKNSKVLLTFSVLFCIILIGIYISRTNIYYPIYLQINQTKFESLNKPQVLVSTTLGQKLIVIPDSSSKNHFKLDYGYFYNIIVIPTTTEKNNSEEYIKIYNSKTKRELKYKYTLENEKIIISSVGEKSIFKRVLRIFEINLKKLILLLLIVSAIYFAYFSWRQPKNKFAKPILKINSILLYSTLFVGFFLLFLAAFHSFPNAEDIALTSPDGTFKPISNAVKILLVYDARYTANVLYGLDIFTVGGVKFHKINSIFIILITSASALFLFKQIFKQILKTKDIIVFGFCFVLLHFALSPSIAYDIFYIGSSYVYLVSWIFIFTWVGFFFLICKANSTLKKLFFSLITFLTLFLSFGTIELNIFINFYIILIIGYYTLKYRRDLKHEFFALSTIFILSSLFIAVIPGNSLRVFGSPIEYNPQYFLQTFKTTFIPYFYTVFKWTFLNPVCIPIIICISVFFHKSKIADRVIFSSKELIFTIIGGFSVMYFCYYIFVFTNKNMINDGYPIRLINYINWAYGIIIFILTPILLGKVLPKFLDKLLPQLNVIITYTILLSFVFIAFQPNEFKNIFLEFNSGKYRKYKMEMNNRFEKISEGINNPAIKTIILEEIKTKPSTLFIFEKDLINNDAELELWIEKFNRHFNTDKITFKNDSAIIKIKNYDE
ncbi:MAG: hypothetical protein PHP52_07850 [Bacteroidales bacterium]|nr:hypothetical protein [Bacteroidales bacterium]